MSGQEQRFVGQCCSTARWAVRKFLKWMTVHALETATFILALATVWLASAANRQIGIMENDQRPWVYAGNIAIVGPLVHGPEGLRITLNFTLMNVGHSPAQNTFIGFVPSLGGWGRETLDEACKNASQGTFVVSVFPGDSVPVGASRAFLQADIEKARSRMAGMNGAMLIPSITACVAYQAPGEGKFHYTPYAFSLGMVDKNAARGCCNIPFDEPTIPAEAIALQKMPIANIGLAN